MPPTPPPRLPPAYARRYGPAIVQKPPSATDAFIKVVQSAQSTNTGTQPNVSVTVTLPQPTKPGNCLVACVVSYGSTGASPTVASVTLGGVADNWASLYTKGISSDFSIASFWIDNNCAGGQTSIVVNCTGGAGTTVGADVIVYEVSGLAAFNVLDQVIGDTTQTGSTSWTSTATGTTTQSNEIAFGVVAGNLNTITGPSLPWVNSAQQTDALNGTQMAGYQILSSTGTVTYSGTFSPGSGHTAAVVTLKAFTNPVVQAAPTVHLTSLTGPVNVTLDKATSAGNTLVVCVASNATLTANPHVSAVTLGGSADNFAQAVQLNSATRKNTEIWYDPNCASGQTAVAVTFAGGGGTGDLYVSVYEVSGKLTADKVITAEASGATLWSSGPTASVTKNAEIFFGSVICNTANQPIVTGSGSWIAQGSNVSFGFTSGYQAVNFGGTSIYSGTMVSGDFTTAVATFYESVGAQSASATPSVVSGTTSIPAPTVKVSAQPAVVAGTASIAAPTGVARAQPVVVAGTRTIAAPGISASLTASVVSGTAAIPAPGISASLTASVVSGTATIPVPTVSTSSPDATINATVVSGSTTISAPGISASFTANVVNGVASIAAPTERVLAQSSVVQGSGTIPGPGISASLTASVVTSVATIPQPRIPPGPATVVGTASIPAPTVAVRVQPIVVAGTRTIPQPGIPASPSVVSGIASIPVPGISASLTANVVAVSTTIPVPSVSGGGSATVNAVVVSATSTVPVPGIVANSTINVNSVLGTSIVPVPGISVSLRSNVVNAITAIPVPLVPQSAVVSASVVLGSTSITSTNLVHISSLLNASVVSGNAAIPAPVLHTSSVISAALVISTVLIPQPSVVITEAVVFATSVMSEQPAQTSHEAGREITETSSLVNTGQDVQLIGETGPTSHEERAGAPHGN